MVRSLESFQWVGTFIRWLVRLWLMKTIAKRHENGGGLIAELLLLENDTVQIPFKTGNLCEGTNWDVRLTVMGL